MYHVKEIYFTLQGEGAHTGRASVFCRFSGCNLWSGLERDRHKAKCYFCDTDFVGTDGKGGGSFKTASELADAITEVWHQNIKSVGVPYVVFTGGEPTLQLDEELVVSLKKLRFEVAIETNGTRKVPQGVDWITVSPKPGSPLVQTVGDELKLVYPHEVTPESVSHLLFKVFYLMPLYSTDEQQRGDYLQQTITYCQLHPQWRLTLQAHKIIGLR